MATQEDRIAALIDERDWLTGLRARLESEYGVEPEDPQRMSTDAVYERSYEKDVYLERGRIARLEAEHGLPARAEAQKLLCTLSPVEAEDVYQFIRSLINER